MADQPPEQQLGPRTVQLRRSAGLVPYEEAVADMEARVAAIYTGDAPELVWLLEHPPLYTAGTSAQTEDLLAPERFPVFKSGRGGQYTYHGPGQRVTYVMLDLNRHGKDLRAYVQNLEAWMIAALARFGVTGETRCDRIGIWVPREKESVPPGEDKIGAIGVRVRRWITFHGVAVNVEPDLDHFTGIVPCGVSQQGVTSLKALGKDVAMADIDAALKDEFESVFGVQLVDEP
ncbi:MAG: lipoyl(octanoyl) transferase LipB [Rhodospirillaceae bacterium]|nr:lipoyl(octanoyl) transferase LipB [Rhodospirillaceae bacterium]